MSSQENAPAETAQPNARDLGPFVLKTLLEDVPLSADGDEDDIVINCVEYFDGNLYVGTSASEILHFVQIPPDPSDADDSPTYILASRLAPAFSEKGVFERPGVQQILLLPAANKACVLCNSTVTFYSLPELSPAFGNQKVPSCNWIGGLDLNRSEIDLKFDGDVQPVVTLLSTKKRIQSVRIGEEPPRVVKSIDFAGCVLTIRRDNYACVADTHSYSLLDVDRQQKINLFPVSSLDTTPTGPIGGRSEDISGDITGRSQRSTSSAALSPPTPEDRSHGRSTSLGTFMGHNRKKSNDRLGRNTPDLFRDSSPVPTRSPNGRSQRERSPEKPLPPAPSPSDPASKRASMVSTSGPLKPHIISPSSQEFLLVTGTSATDPGVGMFVNLEGEVTRSTLEFGRYPEAVVADGRGVDIELSPGNAEEAEEGYVLAVISKDVDDMTRYGLEIQRWDLDAGESASEKSWLEVPNTTAEAGRSKVGVRSVTEPAQFNMDEVVQKLRIARFRPFPPRTLSFPPRSSSKPPVSIEHNRHQPSSYMKSEDDEERAEEELLFAKRLGRGQSRVVVWSGNKIWLAARNPLVLRLEAQMGDGAYDEALVNPKAGIITMSQVINSIRGREARTEIEFLSLGYIRQRAGLLLLTDLISRDSTPNDAEYNAAQEAMLEGALDPRVVVALSPRFRGEVMEGKAGIWISAGIVDVAEKFLARPALGAESWDDRLHVLQFYRRFLGAWRKQKGFGSTTDETEKFNTVDAALLLVLLQLGKDSPPGFGKRGSARSELHDVVDHGVECFDRGVEILEEHKRLYVLSRLYQSRKMAGEVLATWRRIIEGEQDDGGEFTDGEQRVRDYLTIIRNANLVEEYGVWLASRNPKLGVQVFADERSRVAFEPKNVVEILRAGAPGAVKEYLEYLVFGKGMNEYGTELISYYLDIVVHEMENSAEARDMLQLGYETYRALESPKPTYRQFIHENGIDADWWRARLRLLQLLGGTPEVGARRGSTDEQADYDLPSILNRIEPYRDLLVPELIILDGRQGRHDQALRLLVHGLGDHDTAINYCLAGGSSIYHPISGTLLSSGKSMRSVNTNGEDTQQHLFDTLLSLFLALPDRQSCIDQTSNLLSRFGSYFDILDVLSRVPEEWSVAVIDTFLISRVREIVTERNETMIVRALRGSENIQVAEEFIDKVDTLGYTVEGVE